MQEGEGLVDGGVRVKAVLAVLELVMQDDFQALREALRLFLQPELLLMQSKGVLLQILILPALCGECDLASALALTSFTRRICYCGINYLD